MRVVLLVAGLTFGSAHLPVAAAVPAPSAAAKTAPSGYTHPHSGATIPGQIAGHPRSSIKAYDDTDLDVSVSFTDETTTEITSIYIFRNVSGSVPVWFDRAQWAIESGNRLGRPSLVSAAAFTPPGFAPSSGLRAVYSLEGGDFRSTAVGLTSAGDWYIKVRASSARLEPTALLERMNAAFASIRWPQPPSSPPIAPIADCTIGFPELADAEPVNEEQQLAAALVGSTVRTVPKDIVKETGAALPEQDAEGLFCRGDRVDPMGQVYRRNESTGSYLLALGDGGRGLWVGRSLVGGLGDVASDAKFSVEFQDMSEVTGYGSFKTLPPPRQAQKLFDSGEPIYSASTWGPESKITIHTIGETPAE